jgi:hypothetical protein
MSSSLNRTALTSDKGDERKSALMRGIAARSRAKDKAMSIVGAMPAEATLAFEALSYNGRLLQVGITLALTARNRDDACRLLGLLPPIRLTRVRFDRDDRGGEFTQTWPVTYNPGGNPTIRRRQDIAPFLFSVQQGPGYGPKHQLYWATKLGEYEVAVQAHLATDPAQFELLQQVYPQTHRQPERRFKWEPGRGFPEGPKFGKWGQWGSTIPDAMATVYWPLDGSHGLAIGAGYMQTEDWTQMARFALREEAQR